MNVFMVKPERFLFALKKGIHTIDRDADRMHLKKIFCDFFEKSKS